MMGIGEKPRNIQKTKQRKKFPIWLPSHPPIYKMEADSFPMSENTENKPDLENDSSRFHLGITLLN